MCFLGKGMAGWSWFFGWFWSDFVLCLVAVKSKGKEALNLGFWSIYLFIFVTFPCFLGNQMEGWSFFFLYWRFSLMLDLFLVVGKRGFWMISSLSFRSCKMRTTQISCLKWCLSSSTILRNSSTIWPKLCKNLFPFTPCLVAEKILLLLFNCLSLATKQSPIVLIFLTEFGDVFPKFSFSENDCYFSICAVNNRLWNSNRWMPMSTSSRAVVPGNYRFSFLVLFSVFSYCIPYRFFEFVCEEHWKCLWKPKLL